MNTSLLPPEEIGPDKTAIVQQPAEVDEDHDAELRDAICGKRRAMWLYMHGYASEEETVLKFLQHPDWRHL